ncbi:MAG TPA: phosphoribosylformylglycinamidine synthase subunit PurS [Abditibacteriaceae bacterium]|jgi:phosphoribosylformylglycinamidine synthase
MAIAEIYVTLKPALLDVQGTTVLKSLHQLGHTHAADVRIGKYITVAFDDALSGEAMQAHLDAMCRELLANPVIEDYRIEIGGSTAAASAPTNGIAGPSISRADAVPNPSQTVAAPAATTAQVSAARITAPQAVAAVPAQSVAQTLGTTAAPLEVATAPAAASAPSFADPFATDYTAYTAMSADEKLALQGRAWQEHGAWIEGELAARRAVWILCVGPNVVESGETLDSYPADARLDALGTANDLVPWVFTRAPQD